MFRHCPVKINDWRFSDTIWVITKFCPTMNGYSVTFNSSDNYIRFSLRKFDSRFWTVLVSFFSNCETEYCCITCNLLTSIIPQTSVSSFRRRTQQVIETSNQLSLTKLCLMASVNHFISLISFDLIFKILFIHKLFKN